MSNLKLHFCSIPDDGLDAPITMSNTINVKSTVQSSFSNVSCAVPAICRGVTGTFILQDDENSGGLMNPLSCQTPPDITSLEFIYNNTINNSLVSYQITDYAEMLKRYVRSVTSSDHNNASLFEVRHDDGFGIGLNFDDEGGLIDLRKDGMNIQISSGVRSDKPYTLNLFFHGVQTI